MSDATVKPGSRLSDEQMKMLAACRDVFWEVADRLGGEPLFKAMATAYQLLLDVEVHQRKADYEAARDRLWREAVEKMKAREVV